MDAPQVRAFVDHPVTDIVAATRAAETAAQTWGLEPPTLQRVGMNVIFVSADTVLRVSEPTAPAEAAIALCEFLGAAGLRVPVPAQANALDLDGLSVTCWERIEVTTAPIDWRGVGMMVRQVHDLDPARLPASVPLPHPENFPWWDFGSLLDSAAGHLDADAAFGLRAAVERHAGWADTSARVLCHGDVHPGNVLMSADGPVLIDWDLLCWGPRGWDHAPMMTWQSRWGGAPGAYEAFADGYGGSLRGDPVAEAIAELRLVAATLMRVIAGSDDPTAMPEAQSRLQYWRGDPDAPAWQAQ